MVENLFGIVDGILYYMKTPASLVSTPKLVTFTF
jgi:hypothetical protein